MAKLMTLKTRLRITPLLILIGSVTNCANLNSIPTTELESRHLVGHWESEDGYINIYCNGAISTKLPGDEIFRSPPNNGAPNQVTSGQHITAITNKGLIIGALWPTAKDEYSVQRWPYKTEKGLQMRMLNVQWTRTAGDSCK